MHTFLSVCAMFLFFVFYKKMPVRGIPGRYFVVIYVSEASHDWKSQASFHGLTHPCWAEPVKRRFPVAVFRYLPVYVSTESFSL